MDVMDENQTPGSKAVCAFFYYFNFETSYKVL